MYCTKCGKKADQGDVFCSACGHKLGSGSGPEITQSKSRKGFPKWILILVALGIVGAVAGTLEERGTGPKAPAEIPTVTVQKQETVPSQEPEEDLLPPEPKDGDVLENSEYSNGITRRWVDDYGTTVYVCDYRPDGTTLRDTVLMYTEEGKFASIRVTNYDDRGNPTDTTETESDGALWLHLYYENVYDIQGRPLRLVQYNRMGNPLYIYSYTYNSDGTYTMEITEYRGFVYEYDLEFNPEGTTSPWYHSITTFNSAGEPVDQYITMMDGVPVE